MIERNGPCPCGSGKKYKKCCLVTQQVVSLDAVRLDRAYNTLLSGLEKYVQTLPAEDLLRAQMQFLGHLDAQEPPEFPEGTEFSFLDWYCFNYRQWATAETPLESLLKLRGPISDTEQELYEAWRSTHPSFYRCTSVSGGRAILQDLITGMSYTFDCTPYAPPAQGTISMGRILPVGQHFRPSFDLVTGDDNFVEQLLLMLPIELGRMRLAYPSATISDLLRERWPLIRSLTVHSSVAAKEGTLPDLTHTLPAPSLGISSPPPECPAKWITIYEFLVEYVEQMELPAPEAEGLYRLWWDSLVTVSPKAPRPATWAAAIAYTWHRWVTDNENFSSAMLSEIFGPSDQTIENRSEQIAEALQIHPQDDRYMEILDPSAQMMVLSLYYPQGGDLDEEDLQEVIALNSKAGDLMATNLLREARTVLTEALEIMPNFPPAQNNLALIHFLEGDTKGAIDYAQAVLSKNPGYLFCLSLLAQANAKLGKIQIARDYLVQAVAIFQTQFSEMADEPYTDRQRLWEALIALGEDQILVELALSSRIKRADATAITLAAIAADRIGDRANAKTWLKLAQSKANGWTLPKSLLSAIDKMEMGWVPAFPLDYELTPISLAPLGWQDQITNKKPAKSKARQGSLFPTQRLDAAAKAVLMDMIWSGKHKTVISALEVAIHQADPWVPLMLRGALTRPEIADKLKPMIVGALLQLGSVEPGEELLIYMNGALQPGQVSAVMSRG